MTTRLRLAFWRGYWRGWHAGFGAARAEPARCVCGQPLDDHRPRLGTYDRRDGGQ